MPYIAAPDEATVAAVRDGLLAVACRHADTPDAFIRIPRTSLRKLAAPGVRREDFYEAVRQIAKETDAIREANGTGRRVDVVLRRVAADAQDVRARLVGLGLDVTSPIPTGLLIRRVPRVHVVHDPEQPRTCPKCCETKPTTEFDRRSADPDDKDHRRFQSYCRDCSRTAVREFNSTL